MLGVLWYFATIVASLVWLVGSPLGAKLSAAELVSFTLCLLVGKCAHDLVWSAPCKHHSGVSQNGIFCLPCDISRKLAIERATLRKPKIKLL